MAPDGQKEPTRDNGRCAPAASAAPGATTASARQRGESASGTRQPPPTLATDGTVAVTLTGQTPKGRLPRWGNPRRAVVAGTMAAMLLGALATGGAGASPHHEPSRGDGPGGSEQLRPGTLPSTPTIGSPTAGQGRGADTRTTTDDRTADCRPSRGVAQRDTSGGGCGRGADRSSRTLPGRALLPVSGPPRPGELAAARGVGAV